MVPCVMCGQTVPPHCEIEDFIICGECGDTLVVLADGTTRKALGVDVDRLTPEALKHLRLGLAGFRASRRSP